MEKDILGFVSDDGRLSNVMRADSEGKIYNKKGKTMTANHYLVLDGYQPEPEQPNTAVTAGNVFVR